MDSSKKKRADTCISITFIHFRCILDQVEYKSSGANYRISGQLFSSLELKIHHIAGKLANSGCRKAVKT